MNSRPLGPEPSTLPAALHPEKLVYYRFSYRVCQVKYLSLGKIIVQLCRGEHCSLVVSRIHSAALPGSPYFKGKAEPRCLRQMKRFRFLQPAPVFQPTLACGTEKRLRQGRKLLPKVTEGIMELSYIPSSCWQQLRCALYNSESCLFPLDAGRGKCYGQQKRKSPKKAQPRKEVFLQSKTRRRGICFPLRRVVF